jgi:hypothetical protein
MTLPEIIGWLGVGYLAGVATILALDFYGRMVAKRLIRSKA